MNDTLQQKNNTLALIPARGGSKSVPRKNILQVGGKPLIAYSIEQALKAKNIQRVIVSTDDSEIMEIAKTYGAEVPFRRPDELAQDHSLDLDVVLHALKWLKKEENYQPDVVVYLYPTTPIRRITTIDKAIELFHAHQEADSLRSIVMAEQSPYKMWRMDGNYLSPVVDLPGIPEPHNIARQQLPKAYVQTGYIDMVRSKTVLEKNSMLGETVLPYIIEEPVPEIDYHEHISIIEAALKDHTQESDFQPETKN
ncbi:MAG: acylneuraminate cytidylyltransferase family protein, partial [Magnetococcales bacterium]|nr:acylneuraminate cytidylyltransferase family protein [Magnetococcales bacterium]